ncbi:MAG: hypothetical protein WD669_07550 [Pirellulales bacterium]|jgi:hypothetical protein
MRRYTLLAGILFMGGLLAIAALSISSFRTVTAQDKPLSPRSQPGTDMTIYSPKLHGLYDGKFLLSCGRTYVAGSLSDKEGWEHIDNAGQNSHPVEGTVEIDVDEIKNTGKFVARLELPEGLFELTLDKFKEGMPCQDGGVASMIFEHGDSGCGNTIWPKTLLYIAGWGTGSATLNGKPLYTDYDAHFMVTQGIRDRKTLKVNYPVAARKDIYGKSTMAGQVNPAAMQCDFWIRSPKGNNKNNPPHEHFMHFYSMEVTWK